MCKREFIFCRSQIRQNGSRPVGFQSPSLHDKKSRTNVCMWLCRYYTYFRPLPAEMMYYARQDTRYLIYLYHRSVQTKYVRTWYSTVVKHTCRALWSALLWAVLRIRRSAGSVSGNFLYSTFFFLVTRLKSELLRLGNEQKNLLVAAINQSNDVARSDLGHHSTYR